MMLAHGITSAGMFFLVGVIYDRAHTRDLNKLGGLGNIMPLYGAISYLIFFGSMGLPGLCGFVAEVFVVLAAFNYSPLLAILAAAAVILTAGYILWTVQRVFLGRSEAWKGLPDLNLREIVIAVPLVVLTIAMGIFPQPLVLSWMSPSVDQMVQSVTTAREINIQGRRAETGQPTARTRCRKVSRKRIEYLSLRSNTLPLGTRLEPLAACSSGASRLACAHGQEVHLLALHQFASRCTLRPTSKNPLLRQPFS